MKQPCPLLPSKFFYFFFLDETLTGTEFHRQVNVSVTRRNSMSTAKSEGIMVGTTFAGINMIC